MFLKGINMSRHFLLILLLCVCWSGIEKVSAQKIAVKTNLLYDATSTLNLGAEYAVADRWSLQISGNYNPWTFSDNRKMKHWLIQPEARYWLCEAFNGHFFGVHAHYAQYNWGGMLFPWGPSVDNLSRYRYEGWLAGGGVSYGYQWILGKHWNLEASLGLGYAYLKYDKHECRKCGDKIGTEKKNYLGPTQAAVSIIYIIK